ncbi:MAG: disulfide bond formation protein B [Pseudomonadota bacterium]
MTRIIACFAGLGSGLLLLAAFWFQYGEGLAPCKMCIWQRYPHGAAFALGLVVLFAPYLITYILGALAALTTSAVGVYHAGVEQKWWNGPSSCTSSDISGLTAEELFDQIMSAPLVRCDEIPWDLFGISMAGWNAIASAGLALLWIEAVRRQIKP